MPGPTNHGWERRSPAPAWSRKTIVHVPARGHLGGSHKRAHQPDRRRPRPRNVHPRVCSSCSPNRATALGAPTSSGQLDYFLRPACSTRSGSQEREWGSARRREDGRFEARGEYLGAPVPHRCELHATVGGAHPRAGGPRPDHVGAATYPRHKESSHPFFPGGRSGLSFRRGPTRSRWQMMPGEATRAARSLRAFDLEALRAARRRGSARPSERVGTPRLSPADFPEGFAEVPGVLGSLPRHALTTHSSQITPGGGSHVGRRNAPSLWTVRSTAVDPAQCFEEVPPDPAFRTGSRTCSAAAVVGRTPGPRPLVVEVDGRRVDACSLTQRGRAAVRQTVATTRRQPRCCGTTRRASSTTW